MSHVELLEGAPARGRKSTDSFLRVHQDLYCAVETIHEAAHATANAISERLLDPKHSIEGDLHTSNRYCLLLIEVVFREVAREVLVVDGRHFRVLLHSFQFQEERLQKFDLQREVRLHQECQLYIFRHTFLHGSQS